MATRKPSSFNSPATVSLTKTISLPDLQLCWHFPTPGFQAMWCCRCCPWPGNIYQWQLLVPSEEHLSLLSIHNPLHCDILKGKWVCCHHGLYHGNVGLVCEHNESSEAKLTISFLPWIPDKPFDSAPKHKRLMHPEPWIWTPDHAKVVWGEKVQKILDNEFVIFGVLVYLWLYNAPSRVSSLGSSLVRLLYPAEDGKRTLSLVSSSAGE